MHATLTSKGQITLPKALRDRFRLSAGDRVEFVLEDGDTVRLVVKRGSARQLKGMLPKPGEPVSLEAMDEAIRKGASDS
ncbi:MAG: AbrB/MazE/SpoVT family DNA-binding domain-containing protein [Ectothiorhodospiraceae bacterium]